ENSPAILRALSLLLHRPTTRPATTCRPTQARETTTTVRQSQPAELPPENLAQCRFSPTSPPSRFGRLSLGEPRQCPRPLSFATFSGNDTSRRKNCSRPSLTPPLPPVAAQRMPVYLPGQSSEARKTVRLSHQCHRGLDRKHAHGHEQPRQRDG